jgi:Uma2 family endonuclease
MSLAIPTDAGSAAKLTPQEKATKMTFAEFLEFDDGKDNSFYELENGELILMPLESETNRRIVSFLFAYFLQQGIPYYRLSMKTEVAVQSRFVGVRIPDLVVLSEELATVMAGISRSLVMLDMPPPDLVVEVVSPSQESRDYRYKRTEYGARGISEYWIVDPMQGKVTVLQWVEGLYEEKVYTGDSAIASTVLDKLELTAVQVLQG